jgi:putative DNA methylase
MTQRKKLIEVALPLDAINRESAREKSIRHGHPSTLHLWWARRPLAAARAVIFAQLVDDPSSVPEEFPTEVAQEAERQRLFRLLEQLVKWENTTNEHLLEEARLEIRRSWARWCRDSGEDPAKLPPFHDPFAGGGALPLEAQRLGLEAYASDLNPVAVVINKAMIEIPPRFAGRPPVNPEARAELAGGTAWRAAAGLADDVRYYGAWMCHEAERRIGSLYPTVPVVRLQEGGYRHATEAELRGGSQKVEQLTVIAWLWARTVQSPNPAARGAHVPLVSSFLLSSRAGKEAWIEPLVEQAGWRFEVRTGRPQDPRVVAGGTKLGRAAFRCLLTGATITGQYIDDEANAGRMGTRMMAIVAEGEGGRVYLSPAAEHERIAQKTAPRHLKPDSIPTQPSRGTFAGNAQGRIYGFKTFGDYFTQRQLVALGTFSDLALEVRNEVARDGLAAGLPDLATPLRDGGLGAAAYADAVSTILAFALSRISDRHSSLATWDPNPSGFAEKIRTTFARQALSMSWDFVEGNPFSGSSGNFGDAITWIAKVIERMPGTPAGAARQADARSPSVHTGVFVSTDPPYFDNISYADLSDFFYVWLRGPLRTVWPQLFSTLLVPKDEELVASPYRHGGRPQAERFFIEGMTRALSSLLTVCHPASPLTIYYAFKQAERDEEGTASTGWESFLSSLVQAGYELTGTWPMRTELGTRMVGRGTNALASSIVLVCRPRPAQAGVTSRAGFLQQLKRELPAALRHLQKGSIAPVDLAQAAIGPGMAVFSRYARVLETDGAPMTVREALRLINQSLDEVLTEQEGEFDADTRWALAWFEQYGMDEGPYGAAETLSTAKNTSVSGLVEAGIVRAARGRVRLLNRDELDEDWDPAEDERLTAWETLQYVNRELRRGGESAAGALLARLGGLGDIARDLAYRLYNVCERKRWAEEGLAYNGLVQSWPEIQRLADGAAATPVPTQGVLEGLGE